MPLKAWILVLTQKHMIQCIRLLIQHLEGPDKDIQHLCKEDCILCKIGVRDLNIPEQLISLTIQPDLSDILPRIQSIQGLKSVGASAHL